MTAPSRHAIRELYLAPWFHNPLGTRVAGTRPSSPRPVSGGTRSGRHHLHGTAGFHALARHLPTLEPVTAGHRALGPRTGEPPRDKKLQAFSKDWVSGQRRATGTARQRHARPHVARRRAGGADDAQPCPQTSVPSGEQQTSRTDTTNRGVRGEPSARAVTCVAPTG